GSRRPRPPRGEGGRSAGAPRPGAGGPSGLQPALPGAAPQHVQAPLQSSVRLLFQRGRSARLDRGSLRTNVPPPTWEGQDAPAALGPPGRPAPHPTTRPPASRPAEYEELLYRRGGTRDALIPPESPKRDAPAADRAPRAAPHGH